MTPEQFKRHGQLMIDWIADYVSNNRSQPVRSAVAPGEVRGRLSSSPPSSPEDFDRVWEDLQQIIMPGITHWQSPNFFAYFPCNNSMPSILGELMSAGLGVQGMLWSTSPSCTELETHVLDWIIELLDLPAHFRSTTAGGGVIQDSASSATLCALLAARSRACEGNDKRLGTPGGLVAYCSEQAHSSVDKAAIISGVGLQQLRKVPTDDQFRMDPVALQKAITDDQCAGLKPFFVVATQGTTSSGAIDPLGKIGQVCETENLWLHVDGAMMGSAACCPELRFVSDGLSLADSYCFNPHKWMLVNFDCSCFYVRNRNDLIGAMSVDPEYLRNEATDSGSVIDYRDWQVPLGRRFRALKLWFVLRSFGTKAIADLVRRHVKLAESLESWVKEDSRFELVAPRSLNLVCFRHLDGDAKTASLLDRVNNAGKLFLTHTRLKDQFVIRMCIGQTNTCREHLETAWHEIVDAC